jgi:hypothetical protein
MIISHKLLLKTAIRKYSQCNQISKLEMMRANSMTWMFLILLVNSRLWLPAEMQAAAPIGTWQLLDKSAGIASMHTAVTRFHTVLMLDRTNIGPSLINLPNGRCRINPADQVLKRDCTAHGVMLSVANNGIRPLFIQTDTWCSSGQFLPDGTLLQTGGNLDGAQKIRRIAPCRSTGTCDWVEDPNTELADPRWYATDQLLPDGRVIVVGGRWVFTYEFVPKAAGEGTFPLPFLTTTNDAAENDNYYPYVHLLPNGNLYIFANRDSIELNYNTGAVVQYFPRIPGEPRNYPSAGSSVLLPLDGPSGYKTAEIMVCGGAQLGAFLNSTKQLPTSLTCGRMVVTAAKPVWTMSNMPMRRCMGDMITLPSGEVLIINGAGRGSQGFGLASQPVLNPVIYNPGQLTFSVLQATTIPRVYHSTANLLPDGRILVAGSNTHYNYTFTGTFPTELRVEAFSPPYLASVWNARRPQIMNAPGSIRHGQTFTVVFTLPGQLTALEMNLLSAPFTTHSFSMGQRMLKLNLAAAVRVGANTYSVAVTAPPNGNIAPPAYYMLFPLTQGIPGKAAWIKVTN